MPDILVMPYLYLADRAAIDGWEVIPRRQFEERDAASGEIFANAPKYLDLYQVPDGARRDQPGCLLRPPGARVGGDVDRDSLPLINKAVLAAVLDANEPLDSKRPNAHQHASVSDNCLLYGHPYNTEGRVVVDYGFMVRTTVAGLNVNRSAAPIAISPEVHVPGFGHTVDTEYASALHALLARKDDAARRLEVTIDWLDLAWRNTPSIDGDTRIVALRAAFEVLLDAGEKVEDSRAAFATLHRLSGARSPRQFISLKGNPRTEDMYDEEWWFTRFVWLRNKIMHGSSRSAADYEHEGRQHFHIADETLRRSIKLAVVAAGFPEHLLKTARDRRVERAVDAFVMKVGLPTVPPPPKDPDKKT